MSYHAGGLRTSYANNRNQNAIWHLFFKSASPFLYYLKLFYCKTLTCKKLVTKFPKSNYYNTGSPITCRILYPGEFRTEETISLAYNGGSLFSHTPQHADRKSTRRKPGFLVHCCAYSTTQLLVPSCWCGCTGTRSGSARLTWFWIRRLFTIHRHHES